MSVIEVSVKWIKSNVVFSNSWKSSDSYQRQCAIKPAIQIQVKKPTEEKLITLVVPEIASKSTLFAGSNTGISFSPWGPISLDRMVEAEFLFGLVVKGCVKFAIVVRFSGEMVVMVSLMTLSSAVEMTGDDRVGVVLHVVDFPLLTDFTMGMLKIRGLYLRNESY